VSFALIAFVVSLVILAYTFAGYPLLLMIWARIADRAIYIAPFNPHVVIVVVVHNGAELMGPKMASCMAQDYPADRLRMLVVSDGSDDNISEVVDSFGNTRVKLLALPQRRGKAACLNDAVATCDEEIIVFTDARQAFDPSTVRHLVDNFADSTIGAVSGQLIFERNGITNFGDSIDAYWRYEKFLRKTESRIHSSVGVTGAIYALRRSCFQEIPPDTILDDVLIPMNVVAKGHRVIFEDQALAYDRPSRDAKQERVRKVRTLAGNFQLLFSNPWLLNPRRNPIALQLISHKVMRLIAPLAMAVALLCNFILVANDFAQPFARTMLLLQLTAYAMAVLGALWPMAAQLRLIRLASAFVSLNWFVVLGFVEFISNRNAHLWNNHQAAAKTTKSVL
jgi:poly-beta-1,6-N-acetyl-D-glucosamine synthase